MKFTKEQAEKELNKIDSSSSLNEICTGMCQTCYVEYNRQIYAPINKKINLTCEYAYTSLKERILKMKSYKIKEILK